jgi:radical SAM-linked protein
MQRIRIRYKKKDSLRFTGMLDIQKIWERWLRRAQLDLTYSQGFHPQPRIHQAAPLPLGFVSNDEIIDIWVENEKPADDLLKALNQSNHPGLEIIHLECVEMNLPPLQTQIESNLYLVTPFLARNFPNLKKEIDGLLKSNVVFRERRGKSYDLRPLIHTIEFSRKNKTFHIEILLSAREGATGRPDEVMSALGYDPNQFNYLRVKSNFISPVFNYDHDES